MLQLEVQLAVSRRHLIQRLLVQHLLLLLLLLLL
jgi:hypothetical protein